MKIKMKDSEARILIFLKNARQDHHYARFMAFKLEMDYIYMIRILGDMKAKKWILPLKRGNKKMYILMKEAPVKEAKRHLINKTRRKRK